MSTAHVKIASLMKEFTRSTEACSDAGLLGRFVQSRDEVAFANIVERYGPMVLGVCRRILGNAHSAEDAFQAVFLALVQHAGRVRLVGSLAPWLYGTAVRVSLKARRTAVRARAVVDRIPNRTQSDPLAEITGRELVAMVDEELARLPETFRMAVVLCCLEGLSHEEAAGRLGWTTGSVKGRLERGRERLRRQFAKRGVVLSAGLGAVLIGSVAEAVPPILFARTINLIGTVAIPSAITGLAAGAVPIRMMPAAAVVAFFALAAGGLAAIGSDPIQPTAPQATKPAKLDEPKAVTRLDRFGDPLPSGAVLRIGTTRLRHSGVFSLTYTADNKLASIGQDYIVRFWDPTTGQQLREREFEKGPSYPHWGGCLSPDGRRLAVQHGNWMKVYDTGSGQEIAAAALASSHQAVAQFSPDGRQLAVFDRDKKGACRVSMCDIAKNTCRELANTEGFLPNPAFSRDGRRLAVAAGFGGAYVWEVATGKELLHFKPENKPLWMVDFDPTGDIVAILGASNPPQSFYFIRVSTGEAAEGWKLPTTGDLNWVRFSPDGATLLMAGKTPALRWFDPKSGKTTHTAAEPARVPAAFSPGGRFVATARSNTLDIWDATTGTATVPKNLGDTPQDEIHGLGVSPDGKWILTKGDEKGQIQIWDNSGQLKGSIESNRAGGRNPLFSADGRQLYGVAPDAIAMVRWEFPGGAETARYTFAEPATDHVYVYHFGLSADGQRLIAITQTNKWRPAPGGGVPGGGGPGGNSIAAITVWDTATARRLESREVEERNLLGYGAFSPDLRWFFMGDRPIPLATDAEYRLELPPKFSSWQAAVSQDGRLIAQRLIGPPTNPNDERTSHQLVVHEAVTGKQVLALPPGPCGPIAFASDNRSLIVTDPDAITRWDLVSLKSVVRHAAPVRTNGFYGQSFASSLVVTPDGTRAVTGHIDTTAIVWDLPAQPRKVRVLSEKELAAAWGDLAGADAGKAFAAVWSLADGGPEVLTFLHAWLSPITAPTQEVVKKLFDALNAPEFAEREAANKKLVEYGDAVIPALRELTKGEHSPEQRLRVTPLLSSAKSYTLAPGERLRQIRAVAVLELLSNTDAKDLLTRLAKGMADARLTREAAAAVERLKLRGR